MPAVTTVANRYRVVSELASGGMATVFLACVSGPGGFSKVVALKRLHPHVSREPAFLRMFTQEATLVSRIRHTNVVPVLEVVEHDNEIYIAMEYVLGASVADLLRMTHAPFPPAVAAAIIVDVLEGLHSAHEARDERGEPLSIVHRDVSPQNILLGSDGRARVLDFGIAKAANQVDSTREGHLKGKAAYMAPEQTRGEVVDRRTDVFAAGIVLWEMLTGRRLFAAPSPLVAMRRAAEEAAPKPSEVEATSTALDAVVLRALEKSPSARFETARDLAVAVEKAIAPAATREVADWLERVAGPMVAERARVVDRAATEGVTPAAVRAETSPAERTRSPTGDPIKMSAGSHRRLLVTRALLAVLSIAIAASVAILFMARKPVVVVPVPAPVPAPSDGQRPVIDVALAEAKPSAEPPPAPSNSATRAPTKRGSGARAVGPNVTPRDRCQPPWTVNDAGIRILKVGCE